MRFWLLYKLFAIILVASVEFVIGGCREQERNACEIVCQMNTTTKRTECNLRAIVILSKMDKVEASLSRVINEYYDFVFLLYVFFFFILKRIKLCSWESRAFIFQTNHESHYMNQPRFQSIQIRIATTKCFRFFWKWMLIHFVCGLLFQLKH